ncbi:MAG: hypothetical protein ACRC14_04695 [Paracoccaceae bacterium]
MIHWFFGFHAPYLRNYLGRIDLRGTFGHCEAWGYNEDETWTFVDPLGAGMRITSLHRHDDVTDALHARFLICDSILKIASPSRHFRVPLHGPMTCASVCGALVGVRALVPASLKRKLIRNGAEIVHETERRPSR